MYFPCQRNRKARYVAIWIQEFKMEKSNVFSIVSVSIPVSALCIMCTCVCPCTESGHKEIERERQKERDKPVRALCDGVYVHHFPC